MTQATYALFAVALVLTTQLTTTTGIAESWCTCVNSSCSAQNATLQNVTTDLSASCKNDSATNITCCGSTTILPLGNSSSCDDAFNNLADNQKCPVMESTTTAATVTATVTPDKINSTIIYIPLSCPKPLAFDIYEWRDGSCSFNKYFYLLVILPPAVLVLLITTITAICCCKKKEKCCFKTDDVERPTAPLPSADDLNKKPRNQLARAGTIPNDYTPSKESNRPTVKHTDTYELVPASSFQQDDYENTEIGTQDSQDDQIYGNQSMIDQARQTDDEVEQPPYGNVEFKVANIPDAHLPEEDYLSMDHGTSGSLRAEPALNHRENQPQEEYEAPTVVPTQGAPDLVSELKSLMGKFGKTYNEGPAVTERPFIEEAYSDVDTSQPRLPQDFRSQSNQPYYADNIDSTAYDAAQTVTGDPEQIYENLPRGQTHN